MTGTDSILGQHEATQASLKAQAGTDRLGTDKNTFLKLLVAQLTHQDPLNPVEDKEFVAQLAQFTSVEELQNLNKGMESLNSAYLRQQSVNATSLIGQYVEAPGDMITIDGIGSGADGTGGYSSPITFTLPRTTPELTMNIYSMDSEGRPNKLVASRNLGPRNEGSAAVQWDGRDDKEAPLPNGTYIANFTAKDADGKDILVTTSSSGKVSQVEMAADGNHKLVLQDFRTVKFNDVKIIAGAADVEKTNTNSGTDTNGSGGNT